MNKSGLLQKNEILAPLNTWHVGGPAKQTYRPADLADLSAFLKTLPQDENIVWLGLGSNVLISDEGINGTVILTQDGLTELTLKDNVVRAEAGVTCAKLAKFCAKNALAEGSFFAGIPGTVGGALAMNAGAFGGETWVHVKALEMIDRHGEVKLYSKEDFTVGYRHVSLPKDHWFVAAHFVFPKTNNSEEEQEKIRALLRERREKQPIGVLSCGSVFRNPPGNFAAKLIEQCGLKGFKIGDAMVSEKHANFIINIKHARASDIAALIDHVQKVVREQTGIELVPEVKIHG